VPPITVWAQIRCDGVVFTVPAWYSAISVATSVTQLQELVRFRHGERTSEISQRFAAAVDDRDCRKRNIYAMIKQ